MLFSVPLFSTNTYIEDLESPTLGLNMVAKYPTNSEGFNLTYASFIKYETELFSPLIFSTINNVNYSNPTVSYLNLRGNEISTTYASDKINESNFAVYDLRKKTRLDSGLAVGNTLFICVILASGALIFSNITQTLVIQPIE